MSKFPSMARGGQLHYGCDAAALDLRNDRFIFRSVAGVRSQDETVEQTRRDPQAGRDYSIFNKILHANDGSEPAFHALTMALTLAQETKSELHLVCVKEVPSLPEFISEVDETIERAGRRFKEVLQRAFAMAEERDVTLKTHIITGHPVQSIVRLAEALEASLMIIGATAHSVLYERMLGSRAGRIMRLAPCPVLVVKWRHHGDG